jgi:hypothetical protein
MSSRRSCAVIGEPSSYLASASIAAMSVPSVQPGSICLRRTSSSTASSTGPIIPR